MAKTKATTRSNNERVLPFWIRNGIAKGQYVWYNPMLQRFKEPWVSPFSIRQHNFYPVVHTDVDSVLQAWMDSRKPDGTTWYLTIDPRPSVAVKTSIIDPQICSHNFLLQTNGRKRCGTMRVSPYNKPMQYKAVPAISNCIETLEELSVLFEEPSRILVRLRPLENDDFDCSTMKTIEERITIVTNPLGFNSPFAGVYELEDHLNKELDVSEDFSVCIED